MSQELDGLCRRLLAPRLAACVCAAVALLTLGAAGTARAAAARYVRVSAQDRASTTSYRRAELAYERAILAAAPASKAALDALAERLRGECGGVVKGVAKQIYGISGPRRTALQRGQEARTARQWSDLTAELRRAVDLTRAAPYATASLAFARTVRNLSWGSAELTAVEHASASTLEWEARGTMPPVCADMKAWVLSGRKRITPSTKALADEREAAARPLVQVLDRLPHGPLALLGINPLARYEGAQARSLNMRASYVRWRHRTALAKVAQASLRSDYALRVFSKAELKNELKKLGNEPGAPPVPPKRRVIGGGVTATGGISKIWVEPRRARSRVRRRGRLEVVRSPKRCRLQLGFKETEPLGADSGLEVEHFEESACLSRSRHHVPRVSCDEGVRRIHIQTLPSARRVRLTLRDGSHITTSVAIVPRRLGGPQGFYYQALSGYAPAPARLTELGAHGGRLATVRLPRQGRCLAPWPFKANEMAHPIVTGTQPGGLEFAILARPGALEGGVVGIAPTEKSALTLQLELANEAQAGGIKREPTATGPFTWQLSTTCEPRQDTILYGVLTGSKDTVWARTATGMQQLAEAQIPSSLHPHGQLAYLVTAGTPRELVVRGPSGATLARHSLAGVAHEASETCEGEAEPPG